MNFEVGAFGSAPPGSAAHGSANRRVESRRADTISLMPLHFLLTLLVALQTGPGASPVAAAPAPGNPIVVISTSHGDITVELFKERAPVSVQNFVSYVSDGFYDGTIFHRVIPGFMIQGGGFTTDLIEKPTRPPILNEATNGLNNTRGTLAMARTQALRSATAQFFINVSDNRGELDHRGYAPRDFGYAVFGRVVAGMEVCDAIATVKRQPVGTFSDLPAEPVIIESARVIEE